MIIIYAYLDDACKDNVGMKMNVDDCTSALDSIMHECKFWSMM
jgi:hypothetical protein